MIGTSSTLGPALLLAATVIALVSLRKRAPVFHIAGEALLLVAIGAFLWWHGVAPLPRDDSFPAGALGTWLQALTIIWWLIGARLVVAILIVVRGRDPRSREARLFSDLTAAVIYITTVLIILNSILKFPITGLLATSGVIAIILGLALQNTLADVFSGIAVGLETPFHVGDRVLVGDDVEGVVVQINWRSIRIRTDGDDLATIPNSIVAKGRIINRSVPTTRRSASVEISVPVEANSDTILELLRHATLLCPAVLSFPAPSVALKRSGVRSASYAVSFSVKDSSELASAKSALLVQMRRMLYRGGIGSSAVATNAGLLASLLIFESLSSEEIEQLASKLVVHDVEPGDVIFQQGSTDKSIYVVRRGVLEAVRRDAAGIDEKLGRLGAGEYVGELGLITGMPRPVTITAITHGLILELPGDSLCKLLDSNAALNAAMERSVRRGLALLDRDPGARSGQTEHAPDLLARIKAFFRL
jgi:small-conductance mechanosensitive channel/CRP-like cAMP-binding protein